MQTYAQRDECDTDIKSIAQFFIFMKDQNGQ